MPRVTFNRATKKRASFKKRRSSTLTKAKYKPKTVSMNRSLIKSNALAIKSMKRMLPRLIYTDYQYKYANGPFINAAPAPFFNILNAELMSPTLWAPVLRKDDNVEQSSQTLIKRMQMNLRYALGQANWCQITTFIVTIRPDAVNRVINEAGLVEGDDYILSPEEFQPRLNSNVFKVLYRRHVSLMAGAWKEDAFQSQGDVLVSNSFSTLKKGQVNMSLNFKVRQPNGQSWRDMDQSQFGPSRRYFQLTFYRGQTNNVDDDPPRVDTDILYTCVNSG